MFLLEDLSPHFENTTKSTNIQTAGLKCSQLVINWVTFRHSAAEQNYYLEICGLFSHGGGGHPRMILSAERFLFVFKKGVAKLASEKEKSHFSLSEQHTSSCSSPISLCHSEL